MGKRRAPSACAAHPPLDRHGQGPPAPAPAPIDPGEPPSARGPIDEHARVEVADAGFRASSYDLQRGLDVVELPTSLPADVLNRLFKSPQR